MHCAQRQREHAVGERGRQVLPGGARQIALSQLATITVTTGPAMIRNEDGLLTGYVFVDGLSVDGYVASDDEAARQQVLALASSIGLRAIDAGPLAVARTLEGMAWLNIGLQLRHGWPWQSGWKLVGPTDKAA